MDRSRFLGGTMLSMFCFSPFLFGRYQQLAICAYKKEDYIEADNLLDKVLVINKFDFEANFWKVRVTVMQREYETAIHLINTCRTFKKAIKMEKLLVPWETFCLKQINEPKTEKEDVISLNKEADELLHYYHHKRDFKLMDVLLITFSYVVLFFCINYFLTRVFNLDITKFQDGLNIWALIFTPIITGYYYYKVTLIPNIYIFIQDSINRVDELFSSKSFIHACFLVILGIFIIFAAKIIGYKLHYGFLGIVEFILFDPLTEELYMRGFLYGYLRRYGKIFSWSIVIVISYFVHPTKSLWHLMTSILCLSVYDEEKTILAPIFLSVLNNGLVFLLTLL